MAKRSILCAFFFIACAHNQPPAKNNAQTPPQEIILESGGELDLNALPSFNVALDTNDVIAYGITEVPADSRQQAYFALADALARAELAKAVRTAIVFAARDNQSESSLDLRTFDGEFARVTLAAMSVPQHGWQKIKRHDETLIRAISRITVPRTKLQLSLNGFLSAQRLSSAKIVDSLPVATEQKR